MNKLLKFKLPMIIYDIDQIITIKFFVKGYNNTNN